MQGMSFFASNDRIRITNAAGLAIFDTAHPMPHILERVQLSNVNVAFPTLNYGNWVYNPPPNIAFGCPYQDCQTVWVYDPVSGTYKPQTQCTTKYQGEYYSQLRMVVHPREWESTIDLATLSSGISPDFLLVNCRADRTKQGKYTYLMSGEFHWTEVFETGIPLGETFMANGTTIFEGSFRPGGISWIRRSMSIFADGPTIKMELKHSNRGFEVHGGTQSACGQSPYIPIPASPDGESIYAVDLDIYAGKFT